MALVVNTNVASITSQMYVNQTNRDMADTMARLSSGKRINTAADDAAGVAIASRLQSEVRGINQAVRNALDAQAMIDTAEGALVEVTNILQRMRELAVQSANDTNNDDDRANLDLEYQALAAEIDRVQDSTTWADVQILDGTAATNTGTFTYLIGTGASGTVATDTFAVTFESLDDMAVTALGDGSAAAGSNTSEIDDQTNALAAILLVDTAIGLVNAERANLGSASNRLDHTVANLSNNAINLEDGRSRIEDADFAAESSALAKNQIMLQAGTAMLAQANASQQNVLSLIS
jgi:flagellin